MIQDKSYVRKIITPFSDPGGLYKKKYGA